MWYLSAVLLSAALIGVAESSKVLYNGYKVITVVPRNESELIFLEQIQRTADKIDIDVWRPTSVVGRPLDIMVSSEQFQSIWGDLKGRGLDPKIMIKDVQNTIDLQLQLNAAAGAHSKVRQSDFNYGEYHELDEIQTWMNDMITEYGNDFDMEQIKVADSFEGREVKGIRFKSNDGPLDKPIFWFHGGIHSREWISPATVIYMAAQLLAQYSTNPDVKDVVDQWEWYIVPVLNVDGYVYTWTNDRMWRKTRTPHTQCVGTDPNRNWGYHWCEEGASTNPCSNTYCGPSAFSEPCTKGVSEFVRGLGDALRVYIDFHSYSQLWMTPWGYTTEEPIDFLIQDQSSDAAVTALEAVHGTEYEHGTIANTIYIASGNTVDWVYGELGVKYSITVELRDKGQFGFLLPPDQIIPSGEETFQGLLALARFVQENP